MMLIDQKITCKVWIRYWYLKSFEIFFNIAVDFSLELNRSRKTRLSTSSDILFAAEHILAKFSKNLIYIVIE